MNRKSFIDLTALLDVILILFFAALINMANGAEEAKSKAETVTDQLLAAQLYNEEIQDELSQTDSELKETQETLKDYEEALVSLYGSDIEDLQDHQEIISKISVIEVALKGAQNELIINGQETDIHIIRASMMTDSRESILHKDLIDALNHAIANRDKSDIIFMKVMVLDREVYKYAYDYLIEGIDEVANMYGKDKILLSKEYD